MLSVHQLRRVFAYFFLLTYLVLLAITWDGIDFTSASTEGPLILGFAIVVWLTYGVIYLLPAILLTWLVDRLVHRERKIGHKVIFYPLAVVREAAA